MQVPFLACLAAVLVFAPAVNAQENLATAESDVFQSSIGWEGYAERAVDGITNGMYWDLSCQHTAYQDAPWWAIDLGESTAVTSVVAYNRIDCCSERTNGLTVLVSDTRLADSDTTTPGEHISTLTDANSCGSIATSSPVMSLTCSEGAVGRYVYFHNLGGNYLTLCEVEIYGGPAVTVDADSLVSSASSDVFQSSIGWEGSPERAVDGITNGMYWDLSCQHTAYQTDPWWGIDIGHDMVITQVVAYNRVDCCSERTAGLSVLVSDTRLAGTVIEGERGGEINDLDDAQECGSIGGSSDVMTINCVEGTVGRYVYIYIPNANYLTLCEVEVFAEEVPCTPSMTLIPNTSTRGATAFEEIQDRDECIQLCIDTEECVAMDWNFSNNPRRGRRCWLHLQPVSGAMRANSRVDHYQFVSC